MKLLICLVLSSFTTVLLAQNVNLSTPEKTIHTLFEGMAKGDSSMVSSSFTLNASLHSVFTTKQGEQKINAGELLNFLEAVGTPHEDIWDERVSNLEIRIDGDLAQAWMEYEFYVGDKFSHCGVNAMHLISKNEEWKIFQIVDTRRKEACK